jgi:hypothetical protein
MTSADQDLADRLRRVLAAAAEDVDDGPADWPGPRPSSRRRRLSLPAASSVVALAGAVIAVLVVAIAVLVVAIALTAGSRRQTGASSSSTAASPTSSTSQSQSPAEARVTPGGVERAILGQQSTPRPTAASCRAPTASEQAQASIGGAKSVFFSCSITRAGKPARFYVQVIRSTGSFIAEQDHQHQDQIFGCCVARPPG